ncbi:L,D-transpeptidase family protein [Herbidospora cretacea]|uniref:L,D-transpeptidase family protein n=1 Tax=Herbidospora cretacea TaxID=28444 RepID=UPI0012FA42B8|nr:L,D-transpeptidase family protein [Herbidospora cretacea]
MTRAQTTGYRRTDTGQFARPTVSRPHTADRGTRRAVHFRYAETRTATRRHDPRREHPNMHTRGHEEQANEHARHHEGRHERWNAHARHHEHPNTHARHHEGHHDRANNHARHHEGHHEHPNMHDRRHDGHHDHGNDHARHHELGNTHARHHGGGHHDHPNMHARHDGGHHGNVHHAQQAGHHRHEHRRPEVMKFGEKSPQIRAMKQRLRVLGFDSGVDDGRYGETTRYAVWAFQKVNGLRMTNRIDQDTMRALRHPRRVRPLVRPRLTNRVEIDVRRQLLTIWRDGKPDLTTHISTGANRSYCDNGHCGFARTPVGTYAAGTRAPGWTTSPLGTMFNSIYFNGGIAMHGSSEVPKYPASHGCIRIPIHTSKIVYAMVRTGEPVHVLGAQSKYV